ncbi:MAG TPA: GMC family oxidoreductase [Gemmatimonadaceae bacterium]|nr:GMC family oxidoreductase [Gemmatimonadaceae bacterium]
MELDMGAHGAGGTLETDVCIVGAGPAGLVVATALAAGGYDVIVLESGSRESDETIQGLNDGETSGDPYVGLRETRYRQLGGATSMWNTRIPGGVGAKYTPLDPIDFTQRVADPLSGWPMTYEDLEPFYRRAQTICGLGSFAYHAADWHGKGREPLTTVAPELESRVYQFGTRASLVEPMLRALHGASNVRLHAQATVQRLEVNAAGRRVSRAHVASPGGRLWHVAASQFVLAAGAIENARLLLCSGTGPHGLGNGTGWVGRCFMEHPRDRSIVLRIASRRALERLLFYDVHDGAGIVPVVGRLALSEQTMRGDGVLNASATLLPLIRPAVRGARSVIGPLARFPVVERWLPRGGHGWSRHPAPGAVVSGFSVLLNLEQAPDPENRLTLSSRRDALDVPRAALHWRWRPRDEASRQRVRAIVSSALERSGLGSIERGSAVLDPNAHHHAGTTRMHADPAFGVVDSDARVHELDNLHLAGASVFPTSGFANPVLTIAALALRLSDRLLAMR